MQPCLQQLDQRQARLGFLNVVAQVGTRQLETFSTILRRFNEVVFSRSRLIPQNAGAIQQLETYNPTVAAAIKKRGYILRAEEWQAAAELPSRNLGLDPSAEERSGVYLLLARWLGLLGGGNGLTELGTILQSLQPTKGQDTERNPLLIRDRPAELAFFVFILHQFDAVFPFLLAARAANNGGTEAATDLHCLRSAVLELQEKARQGSRLSDALKVRGLKEYLARLESENVAWHNSRPRLEFLIDLGLLEPKSKLAHHHAPTEAGARAVSAWRPVLNAPHAVPHFLDTAFFATLGAVYGLNLRPIEQPTERLRLLAETFTRPIARQIGHTPARTIAFAAALKAYSSGRVVEIADLLETFRWAAQGPYGKLLSFSGGSRLDGEFLVRVSPELLRTLPAEP